MPPISTTLIIFNMSLCISLLSWVIVSLTVCIVCIVVNIFIEFWWFLSISFPSLTIQVWVSDLLICLENQGRRRRTWRSWLLFKPWCFGWQVRSKDECSLAFSVHLLSIHIPCIVSSEVSRALYSVNWRCAAIWLSAQSFTASKLWKRLVPGATYVLELVHGVWRTACGSLVLCSYQWVPQIEFWMSGSVASHLASPE